MLQLRGGPALSEFRLQKLLQRLQMAVPAVRNVYAEFVHFAEVETTLSAADEALLARLLTYGRPGSADLPDDGLLLVVPRICTISPWSSKATDIAHNCGLHKVQRLERGTAYFVALEGDRELDPDSYDALLPLVHDRMTEAAFSSFDEAERF